MGPPVTGSTRTKLATSMSGSRRLEQQVQYSVARNGNYGRGYYDRDRDGRDDRYEDDHGRRRDY